MALERAIYLATVANASDGVTPPTLAGARMAALERIAVEWTVGCHVVLTRGQARSLAVLEGSLFQCTDCGHSRSAHGGVVGDPPRCGACRRLGLR